MAEMAGREASEVQDRTTEVPMRKVIASEYVSLDGVVEAPEKWTFQFWNDEHAKYAHDQLFASDALLLGRVTYQGFAAAWPSMEDFEGDFAVRMNTLPKYVVSTTLDEPLEWNNSTLIKGNIADAVSDLKRQLGQDVLIYGSGELVNTLMQYDLIDEYRVWVQPVAVGTGKRLFKAGNDTTVLRLVGTKTVCSVVVVLAYQTA